MPAKRFSRVLRADERPGHCIRCPRTEDLIDLGAEPIQGFGVIYLCTVCTGELADGLSLVPGAHLREAEQKIRELESRPLPLAPAPLGLDIIQEFTRDLDAARTRLDDRIFGARRAAPAVVAGAPGDQVAAGAAEQPARVAAGNLVADVRDGEPRDLGDDHAAGEGARGDDGADGEADVWSALAERDDDDASR